MLYVNEKLKTHKKKEATLSGDKWLNEFWENRKQMLKVIETTELNWKHSTKISEWLWIMLWIAETNIALQFNEQQVTILSQNAAPIQVRRLLLFFFVFFFVWKKKNAFRPFSVSIHDVYWNVRVLCCCLSKRKKRGRKEHKVTAHPVIIRFDSIAPPNDVITSRLNFVNDSRWLRRDEWQFGVSIRSQLKTSEKNGSSP